MLLIYFRGLLVEDTSCRTFAVLSRDPPFFWHLRLRQSINSPQPGLGEVFSGIRVEVAPLGRVDGVGVADRLRRSVFSLVRTRCLR